MPLGSGRPPSAGAAPLLPDNIRQQLYWVLRTFHKSYGSVNLSLHDAYKPSIARFVPVYWTAYLLLSCLIFILNLFMCYRILKSGCLRVTPYTYLFNIGAMNTFSAVFILPAALYVNLRYFWILGAFLCYAVPMLDSLPEYVTMLSFLVIAAERYRIVRYPLKLPFPKFLTIAAIWAVSLGITLPFSIYIKYYSVTRVLKVDTQIGFCLQEDKGMHEYIRALFVVMYAFPLCMMTLLFVKTRTELEHNSDEFIPMKTGGKLSPSSNQNQNQNQNQNNFLSVNNNCQNSNNKQQDSGDHLRPKAHAALSAKVSQMTNVSSMSHEPPTEIDASAFYQKEKANQTYLVYMVIAFGFCWLPLNLMSLVNLFIVEDSQTSNVMDVTYLLMVWVCFVPGCTTPILYFEMSSTTHPGLHRLAALTRRISRLSSYLLSGQRRSRTDMMDLTPEDESKCLEKGFETSGSRPHTPKPLAPPEGVLQRPLSPKPG